MLVPDKALAKPPGTRSDSPLVNDAMAPFLCQCLGKPLVRSLMEQVSECPQAPQLIAGVRLRSTWSHTSQVAISLQ